MFLSSTAAPAILVQARNGYPMWCSFWLMILAGATSTLMERQIFTPHRPPVQKWRAIHSLLRQRSRVRSNLKRFNDQPL